MVNAVGPIFTGGFEEFVVEDETSQYTILYLPDLNNDALQREGKAPVYYWMPGEVRLARKGDQGDFKFHHTHFVGVMSEETHVGIEDDAEVQGGILAFTTTSKYPTRILEQAQSQLLDKFRGRNEAFWGWRSRVAPMFRIAPIRSNITVVTNLAPASNGVAPVDAGLGTGGGGLLGPAGGSDGGPPTPRGPARTNGTVSSGGTSRLVVNRFESEGPVAHGRRFEPRSNLDAWAFQMQGQGQGSIIGGENAYSALMGAYPSEILWSGFHGAYSPMVVAQNLKLPFWSPQMYLRVEGDWSRIFEHFSVAAQGRSLWLSADIEAEFNKMRTRGDIEVELHVDATIPGADELTRLIEERSNLVFNTFMQQANDMIFAPPDPEVEPAEASSPGGFFSRLFGGGGVALKARRDLRQLKLKYEETRQHRYLQDHTISSSMQGFFDEMKNDPDAEHKYFNRLVLGDLGRKVYRMVKPVARWPQPGSEFKGDPIAFMSAQIGYPDAEGAIVWQPSVFQSTDSNEESTDQAKFVRRKASEVESPPSGWTPDKTFVKRRVHFKESMGATDDAYVKVFVEKNSIDLDEDANGSLSNDTVVEVRADAVGKLELEISGIDAILQDSSQIVEVEVAPQGRTHEGIERQRVSFIYKHEDQDLARILEIFTGQMDYVPAYQYRVHVTVKGTLFNRGMSWSGPWVQGNTNGSIMVHVPLADEPGVTNLVRYEPRDVDMSFARRAKGIAIAMGAAPVPVQVPAPPSAGPSDGSPPGVRSVRRGHDSAASGKSVRGYATSSPPPKLPES